MCVLIEASVRRSKLISSWIARTSQFVVVAKNPLLRPYVDSLRRIWSSVSDVCKGEGERNGGTYATCVILCFNYFVQK